jgi:hypothetical protein
MQAFRGSTNWSLAVSGTRWSTPNGQFFAASGHLLASAAFLTPKRLFDHVVGEREQRWRRHGEAERLTARSGRPLAAMARRQDTSESAA